jgi:hypothetical protein
MISKDKEYRTRDGREVRIYSTDTEHGFDGVHGATKAVHGWELTAWGRNGMKDLSGLQKSRSDLVEVKPRIKRTVWFNVYPEPQGTTVGCLSKEAADRFQSPNRIACVKVEIDCEEGEGL